MVMNRLRMWAGHVHDFFTSSYFDACYKKNVHIAQLSLVVLMIGLSGARIAVKPKGIPVTRSDTLGIVMGIKTLVVITYQLLSSHVERYKKWANLKVYAVLNSMEILFWFVVVIITFMGISTLCQGASCGLSWIVVLIAVVLTCLAFWTAVVSTREFKSSKRARAQPVAFPPSSSETTFEVPDDYKR